MTKKQKVEKEVEKVNECPAFKEIDKWENEPSILNMSYLFDRRIAWLYKLYLCYKLYCNASEAYNPELKSTQSIKVLYPPKLLSYFFFVNFITMPINYLLSFSELKLKLRCFRPQPFIASPKYTKTFHLSCISSNAQSQLPSTSL